VTDWIPELDTYCHPLYSTLSPFRGFSDGLHKDNNDSAVSVLVNFGQHAILELPEYGKKVQLQPFDIIFLRTNTVYHRTSPHPSYKRMKIDHLDRWAVTCFFRKKLEDHITPSNHSVYHYAKRHGTPSEAESSETGSSETESSEPEPEPSLIESSLTESSLTDLSLTEPESD